MDIRLLLDAGIQLYEFGHENDVFVVVHIFVHMSVF